MRKGFAIIFAITALFLLGALISIVGVGVKEQARELTSGPAEAQLRQIVIAGAQLSRAGVSGDVALPPEIAGDAALSISGDDDPRLIARFRGREAICPIPR